MRLIGQPFVCYYQQLEAIRPSFYYRLNRLVALAEWQGPQVAMELLLQNPPPTWLAESYQWYCVAADIYRRCDLLEQAQEYA